MEAGADGFEEEIENRATLLGASGDYRPDPLEPALASFATRTLGYVPVDDYEANRLLRQIVGRLDAGCCYKPDVTPPCFLKRRARFAASDVRGTSLTAVRHNALPAISNVAASVSGFMRSRRWITSNNVRTASRTRRPYD